MQNLLEAMASIPKPPREVMCYKGMMADFNKALKETDVETIIDGMLFMPLGLDVVEVPEYNCVLIGRWEDIQTILNNKDAYFLLLTREVNFE